MELIKMEKKENRFGMYLFLIIFFSLAIFGLACIILSIDTTEYPKLSYERLWNETGELTIRDTDKEEYMVTYSLKMEKETKHYRWYFNENLWNKFKEADGKNVTISWYHRNFDYPNYVVIDTDIYDINY
jgi:hypothetical protein